MEGSQYNDDLLERLAFDLECEVSQQKKEEKAADRLTSQIFGPPLSSQEIPTKNENSGGAAHDSGSAAQENDSAEHYESGGIYT